MASQSGPRPFLDQLGKGIQAYSNERKAWQGFKRSLGEYQRLLAEQSPRGKEIIRLAPHLWDGSIRPPVDLVSVDSVSVDPVSLHAGCWAFARITAQNPSAHIDIGSNPLFVAHLSVLMPLSMLDIRPLACCPASINFIKASILAIPLEDHSVCSLSSLGVIGHIGLGRYGDPLDPAGSIKACQELSRVMQEGGNLYISVPIEPRGKTYFNAYRSFSESELLALFKTFTVLDKVYIYDTRLSTEKQDQLGYGCYHLTRNPNPKVTPQVPTSRVVKDQPIAPNAVAREQARAA